MLVRRALGRKWTALLAVIMILYLFGSGIVSTVCSRLRMYVRYLQSRVGWLQLLVWAAFCLLHVG